MASPLLLFDAAVTVFVHLAVVRRMVKLDSLPQGQPVFFPVSQEPYHSGQVLSEGELAGCSSCLLSFIWFVWGSRRVYLAFCPYRRRLFMVDGSRFYHRNRRPFCHSSPIRNLSPFPDGWGSWLYSWLSCMRGYLHDVGNLPAALQ